MPCRHVQRILEVYRNPRNHVTSINGGEVVIYDGWPERQNFTVYPENRKDFNYLLTIGNVASIVYAIAKECNCQGENEISNQLILARSTENSLTQVRTENNNLQGQLADKERQIQWGIGELSRVNNQLITKNNVFDALTKQFNALQIESNNKDNELEKRTNKVRELKEMLGRSQEEIFNHKISIKEGKLEELIQQLGINRERIINLRNAYQQLARARENYNQGSITGAENNIERVKSELLNRGVSVANTQKICQKTEKIAKLRVEQAKLYQGQFEARQQEVPPRNY